MLSLSQGVRNHLIHYTYNPALSADPASKTFDILENIFIETFPIKNFYPLSKSSNGQARGNSFFRFDYNKDETLFSEAGRPSIPLSIRDTQKFGSDLKSKILPIQPELKSVKYGTEVLVNGNFDNGTANWIFTRFNLNSTFTAISTPQRLTGPYGNIAVIGGSFTALNKYFELTQSVQITANKLYELRFTMYSTITEDTTKSISVTLGDSRTEYWKIDNVKKEIIMYLVPYVSGTQKLTIRVNVPRISSYYFDSFSLKEITNYSTNQLDYELFVVNNTKNDMTYYLPKLPKGWYYYNPKEKSYIQGNLTIAPFKALYLIKTNRSIEANANSKFLIK
jgi:hypothetical protein